MISIGQICFGIVLSLDAGCKILQSRLSMRFDRTRESRLVYREGRSSSGTILRKTEIVVLEIEIETEGLLLEDFDRRKVC